MRIRPTTAAGTAHRRCQGDDGAVLVEAALVLPFLVMLVLATVEFGVVWRNQNILTSSLRSASRVASQAMKDSKADLFTLQAFMGSIASAKNVTVKKVIIYTVNETTNPNGNVPNSCKTASTSTAGPNGVSGTCNVYIASQLTTANLVTANFGCASGDYDQNLCPTTRTNSLPATPTTIGIYAEVDSKMSTGLLKASSFTLTDKAVTRVEPSPV
ncbi:MAG TPA: TadE/TadG family type IV pilus assembly protein [Acidimicrobiales bacterium]